MESKPRRSASAIVASIPGGGPGGREGQYPVLRPSFSSRAMARASHTPSGAAGAARAASAHHRRQQLPLALRRQPSRAVLRAPVADGRGSAVAQPGPRVGHGLGHRPAAQPGRLGPLGAHRPRPRTGRRRDPQRQLVPRLHGARHQDVVGHPVQAGAAAGRLHRRLEHLAHRRAPRWRSAVEGARDALLGEIEHPRREVAGVDELDRAVRVARRHDVAAGRDAPNPPGQAEDVVVRAADEPGAHAGHPPGHGGLGDALALGLQRAVVVALGPHRTVLVDRLGGPGGVGVAARDEDEMPEVQRTRARDVGGLVAARVDGGVPGATLQGSEVAGAVAQDVLGLCEQVGAVAAAVKERDLVAAAQGLGGHVAAEEDGAAEDEQAHDVQPISCTCSRTRGRGSTLEGTMRRRRRPDLIRPDRGLQARMVLAAVTTPLVVLASAAALVALAPLKLVGAFGVAAAIGIAGTVAERRNRPPAAPVSPAQAPELHAIVDRLCVLADVPKPEIVIEPEAQPNSWLVGLSRDRARLHVTRGLLDLLTPPELEAVVGHELAHLVNRDAAVMTAVGGPGAVLLAGGKRMLRGGWWFAMMGGAVAAVVGRVSLFGTQVLSRDRELAADAGSAALTGRPAALASALRRISGQLRLIPDEDLRVAACRDVFHLLPVSDEGSGWGGRLSATHPPLERRIARLEKMERAMQSARLGRSAQ